MFKKFIERLSQFIESNRLSGVIIAITSFLIIFLLSLTDAYLIFESKLYDLRFQLKPSIQQWDKLSFLDIDENSITQVGEFPWTRDTYAKGLNVLKQLDVSLSTFDIMFPDSSPMQVNRQELESFKKKFDNGSKISLKDVENVVRNNDEIFASGLADMNRGILSYIFSEEPLVPEVLDKRETREFKKAKNRFEKRSTVKIPKDKIEYFRSIEDKEVISISYPIPEFMQSAHSFGFVNRHVDVDGIIRKVRLVRMFNGRLYFNLAIAMLVDTCKISYSDIDVYPGKRIVLKGALNPMTHIKKDISIPIDEQGMMYINWAGPGPREKSFSMLPFYGLLEYNIYADAVYELFDSIGGIEGIGKRSRLNEELEKAEKKYLLSKNDTERKDNWSKISAIGKKILDTKKGYAKLIEDEIVLMKKELEIKKDPELQKEYEGLKFDYDAINLILKMEKLKDNVIITGLTATGTHDIGTIPIANEYARVGTYHNTVNTVLNGKYIKKAGFWQNSFLMLFFAVIMGFVIQRLDARRSLATVGITFVSLNIMILLLFSFLSVWIDQLGLNLCMLVPSLSIGAVKFLKEESQKRYIKKAFSRYIAPGVIDDIMKDPDKLELGGENRNITIFFSDIAKFSTISEKLTPPQLVALLNEYLSAMTEIILKYDGTIDKYEGDAIMAFWGAPHYFEDHALKACLAAIEMKKKLRDLQDRWKEEGKDQLFVRIGMNTGYAVVGNMGSNSRMDYTAMGDSVNTAARLEGANKFYKTYTMISESTYDGGRDHVEARKLDLIRVVGKNEPISVYELLGRKGELPDRMYGMLEHYNKGMDLFAQREWKKAITAFGRGLKIIEDDGPTLTYIERCETFLKKPPSKKWDGVYKLTSK